MRAQVVITHVQSGKRWSGELIETTEQQIDDMRETLMNNLASMQYFVDANGNILPGDFIRTHCIITVCKVAETK